MSTTRRRSRYITKLSQVEGLTAGEKERLAPVAKEFAFRTNDYYQSLIDWDDPDDPIRRLVIPDGRELSGVGLWDASDEASYTVVNGLEHKYEDTALLLVNNVCGAYCRFCFRKRLFTQDNDEVVNDVGEALAYIRQHPEINNVLLTGGDPLVLSTRRLENVIRQLREIDHVRIIRIGSKMPAFDPFRIVGDPELLEMLARYSTQERKIFLMSHFSHPRELTEVALEGMRMVQRAGIATVSQSPIIRGVNDDPEVIAELFSRLSYNGILPYYLFICRPTAGNDPFMVPIEECLQIFDEARQRLSGLAKPARLCMSHKSGKVEVLGVFGDYLVVRYLRTPRGQRQDGLMFLRRNPEGLWLDDYLPAETPPALLTAATGEALEASG